MTTTPAPGADLATDERTNAAARAIFCVIKPSNMVDADWDSGAVLGLGNAFRSQCINAARATFAAVPASEPVRLMNFGTNGPAPWSGALNACDLTKHVEITYSNSAQIAAPAPVSGMPDLASFWVVEKFEEGKPPSYWDGGSSRSFVTDIDKAIHFCRHEDCFWATRGWHWGDTKLTEHVMLSTTPGAATLPADPAPTEQADSVDLELAAISKEIDRQLDGLMDLSESSFDPTTLALAKEVVKVVAERKAAELPALPARDGDWAGDDWFTTSTMQDYARTALARQSSRIRHLERERDMTRKDCAALAARQAPTEAPKEDMPPMPKCAASYSGGRFYDEDQMKIYALNYWCLRVRQAPESREVLQLVRDLIAAWDSIGESEEAYNAEMLRIETGLRASIAQEKTE